LLEDPHWLSQNFYQFAKLAKLYNVGKVEKDGMVKNFTHGGANYFRHWDYWTCFGPAR
jgi:hypothetical protein